MLRHLLLAVLGALAFAAASQPSARSAPNIDWGFETDGSGWFVDAPDRAVLDVVSPARSGTGAARIASLTDHQTFNLRSDLWMRPVVPSSTATAKLWLAGAPSDFSSVTAHIEVFTGGGALLRGQPSRVPVTEAWAPVSLSVAVPQNAVYARIRVEAKPLRVDATLFVDDVQLSAPTPELSPTATETSTAAAASSSTSTATTTATSTATSTAAASMTATATATQTARATSTTTAIATATATATATARPSPTVLATPAVFEALTNGDFEDLRGLYGWTVQGGSAEVGASSVGSGSAALLVSTSTATKWLHQAVAVVPGGWYEVNALMRTDSSAEEAWLRLAWYASADASGSQLDVEDSPPATTVGAVTLGPVQAPPNARSVRVRLVLRPSSAARTVLQADEVRFSTAAAPAPTPAATVAAGPTVAAPAVPTASAPRLDAAAAESAPTGAPTGQPITSSASRIAATPIGGGQSRGSLLRITELLPNPLEPGQDSDYEWIELANLGSEPADLEGYTLVDNGGTVPLPALTLDGRAALLIHGRAVESPAGVTVRAPSIGFSNGLGNAGDRLALVAADGAIIDAVSWGSDRVYTLGRPELGAPGPGVSILRRFADDGSFVSAEHSASPTPGYFEDSIAHIDQGVVSAEVGGTPIAPDRGWPLLLGLAVLTLGAAGVGRVRRLLAAAGP